MKTKLLYAFLLSLMIVVSKAQSVVKREFEDSKPNYSRDFFNTKEREKSFKTMYVIVQKDSVKQQSEFQKNNATAERKSKKK